jgi:antitoxin component YwqK of YwqJK toxin-antitoxin module
MFQYISSLFLFCLLISCNQTKKPSADPLDNDPNVLVRNYPNTKMMAMRVQIKNQRYDGKFEAYYISGKKKAEGQYKAGRLNGYYHRFQENGTIISKEYYREGKHDSLNEYFRSDGSLEFSKMYKDGLENGELKSFYPNGNLYQDYNYTSGKKEGLQRVFYPNKQLKWKDIFLYGHSTGEFVSFKENGENINLGYSIISKEKDEIKLAHKFTYSFKLDKPAKEIKFYGGQIVNGKRDYRTITPLKKKGDWYIFTITLDKGTVVMARSFIIAYFKTKEGKDATLVKDVTIALTNF